MSTDPTAALLETLLARPDIERRRMLKSDGLSSGGRFFAVLDPDGLVFRLPPKRVAGLVAAGQGTLYQAGARTMKGWVKLNTTFDGDLAALADEAIAAP